MGGATWPAIDWHCQACGRYQETTTGKAPDLMEADDADCDCGAGDSMTLVARCAECGQDLEWGANLCEHMPQARLEGLRLALEGGGRQA